MSGSFFGILFGNSAFVEVLYSEGREFLNSRGGITIIERSMLNLKSCDSISRSNSDLYYMAERLLTLLSHVVTSIQNVRG